MVSLSILIPVFNWDCSRLIDDLHSQAQDLGIPYEIIVADDCSTDKDISERNRIAVENLENCRFIWLLQNTGRAAIRNTLAEQSRYDKLLFLDCDSAVKDRMFLKKYVEAADKASVICGGLIHPDELPERGVELRWTYEKKADLERSAEFRSHNPYSRFTPFSFLIDRAVFLQIRFDESFAGYGYEDVQFGHELEKRGVSMLHIDNPLVHLGFEKNEVYLDKTRQAVRNAYDHRELIGESSLLLTHYNRAVRFRIRWFFRVIWAVFRRSMEKNLLGERPSVRVFSFYKLCYICSLD
ncbi:MAG: glycosyltransferase family 2 protein [Bacteroidaceae bacterium]|nr:glycosyltransferase family 2 protein [Bacteroidaceae bacterium]